MAAKTESCTVISIKSACAGLEQRNDSLDMGMISHDRRRLPMITNAKSVNSRLEQHSGAKNADQNASTTHYKLA